MMKRFFDLKLADKALTNLFWRTIAKSGLPLNLSRLSQFPTVRHLKKYFVFVFLLNLSDISVYSE